MKKTVLMLLLTASVCRAGMAQEQKVIQKINLAGVGYGLEYFFSPKISFHNEIGFSFWEKLQDRLEGNHTYSDLVALNPYFKSSLRCYLVPMHAIADTDNQVGWRISASYSSLYATHEFLRSQAKSWQQMGIFAGTSLRFSKNLYLELELGPAYVLDDFGKDRFDFRGNFGLGFAF